MVDRNGSRALLVVSAVTVSGCCVALAGTQGRLWFYVAFGLSPLMFSTPFEIGTTSAVTKWFVRRRARAMSLLIVSTGAGLTVAPLVVAAAIDIAGWRAAWLTLAVIAIAFGVIPQWLLLVRRPEDVGLEPDGTTAGPEPSALAARIGGSHRRRGRDQLHEDPGATHPDALAADGLHPGRRRSTVRLTECPRNRVNSSSTRTQSAFGLVSLDKRDEDLESISVWSVRGSAHQAVNRFQGLVKV